MTLSTLNSALGFCTLLVGRVLILRLVLSLRLTHTDGHFKKLLTSFIVS